MIILCMVGGRPGVVVSRYDNIVSSDPWTMLLMQPLRHSAMLPLDAHRAHPSIPSITRLVAPIPLALREEEFNALNGQRYVGPKLSLISTKGKE